MTPSGGADDGTLVPGTLVGGFRVDAPLGGGGMGTVYAGVEPTIGKRVAIKVLRRALADDPSWLTRFEREARAANEVHHPGIVDVFAFGRLDDGRPYLVMSLLEGRSLKEALAADGTLPLSEAWRVTRALAEALSAAHARGIVHRDLKPDNVFLEAVPGRPAVPRILDFGIAKMPVAEGAEIAHLTQSGVVLGTPAYMAPEQWWGKGIDVRADQYALGGLLFHALTGGPPFGEGGFVELLQRHLHSPPPTLAEKGLVASAEIEAVLARLLAKSPGDRFPSMDALVVEGDRAFGAPATDSASVPLRAPAPSATPSDPYLDGPTELALTPIVVVAPRGPRFVLVFTGLAVSVAGGLFLVGYAGPDAREVLEWFHIGGFGTYVGGLWFLLAALLVLRSARRRAEGAPWSRWAVTVALFPAATALFSTYSGWARAMIGLAELEPTRRFAVLHLARYEANANRFLGYAMTGLLCLALAALPGLAAPGAVAAPRTKRALLAALGVIAVLLVAAVEAGVPSAALPLGAAVFALSLGLLFPLGLQAPRALAIERALFATLGTSLFAAVGLSRIEAREAALWDGTWTRAERVLEVISTDAERSATTPLALAAVLTVAGVHWLETRRLGPGTAASKASFGARALVGLCGILALTDVGWYALFVRDRVELRSVMASQFTLFAELDPPPAEVSLLDGHAPKSAPALQVARSWVAIDGVRTTKLLALESEVGAQNLARDLGRALAGSDALGGPDLSVSIDRTVPRAVVARVLAIAYDAGARHVELLFTRGATPYLPVGAPVEASYVVVEDFVALPARLAHTGTSLAGDGTFGEMAPALQREGAEGPVTLAVPTLRATDTP